MRGHVYLAAPPVCGSSGSFAPVTNCYKKNGTNHVTRVKFSPTIRVMGAVNSTRKQGASDRSSLDRFFLEVYYA